MNALPRKANPARRLATLACAAVFGLAAPGVPAREVNVALSGSQEIPPVSTSASGRGKVVVGPDRSLTASVTIEGMVVTVAHIHDAAAGANGPIIIPLTMTAAGVWSVPAGTRLADAQYESFKAGNLYFNIHSAAHRGGEIRGQIKP